MTITIDSVVGVVGAFLLGVGSVVLLLVLLVAFGHWHIHMEWMNPARAAGLRRFAKLLFFPIFGALVTNGAAWTVALLTNFHVDPTLANAGGILVGAAVGGVHQGMSWSSSGGPPPEPGMTPAAPVPAPIPVTVDPAGTPPK